MRITRIFFLLGLLLTVRLAHAGTIYVDDDNTTSPWDGSFDNPYQYIQDGIDAADSGDIIYVYNGTYFENIVIDIPIILIGENKNNTIIDGRAVGNTIKVNANHVTRRPALNAG